MGCCLPLEMIKKSGLDFDNFSKLAYCNGARVTAYRANERSEDEFRSDIARATSSANEFIVVSYDREFLGMDRIGNFSPVAGYNSLSDLGSQLSQYHLTFSSIIIRHS